MLAVSDNADGAHATEPLPPTTRSSSGGSDTRRGSGDASEKPAHSATAEEGEEMEVEGEGGRDDGSPAERGPSSPSSPFRGGGEVTNVRVMVRVRPFSQAELELGDPSRSPPVEACVYVRDNTTISVVDAATGAARESFAYDRVFWSVADNQRQPIGPGTTFAAQEDVFATCGAPVIDTVFSGCNACIFAYGQTGSGKSYSMLGSSESPGLIPRIVAALFAEVAAAPPHIELTLSASFLEIYNEKVKDLLDAATAAAAATESPGRPVRGGFDTAAAFSERRVRYTPELGTHVVGLRRVPITSAAECELLLSAGTAFRATASTRMNDQSSRSHAILQLHVWRKDTKAGVRRSAVLNLVDLAGSERIKMSGVTGQALLEAKNINLSLTTLRRVIDVLIENAKRHGGGQQRQQRPAAVAPYRESMLTWVLSDSLGGNCRTAMLGTVSPHVRNVEDTLNTLRYALKAKAIACVVRVNEEKCAVVVSALRQEMDEMKRALASTDTSAEAAGAELALRGEQLARRTEDLRRDQAGLTRARSELQGRVVRQNMALRKVQSSLSAKRQQQEEAERLGRVLEEIADMKVEMARRLGEEAAINAAREREIAAARVLEEEIRALEARQKESQEVARAALQHERQKSLAQIFAAATAFGRDRHAMVAVRANIDALNVRSAAAREDGERKARRCATIAAELRTMEGFIADMTQRVGDLDAQMTSVLEAKATRAKALGGDTRVTAGEAARVAEQVGAVADEIALLHTGIPRAQEEAAAQLRQRGAAVRALRLRDVELSLALESSARQHALADEAARARGKQVEQLLLTIQELKTERRAACEALAAAEADVGEAEREAQDARAAEAEVSEALLAVTHAVAEAEKSAQVIEPRLEAISAFVEANAVATLASPAALRAAAAGTGGGGPASSPFKRAATSATSAATTPRRFAASPALVVASRPGTPRAVCAAAGSGPPPTSPSPSSPPPPPPAYSVAAAASAPSPRLQRFHSSSPLSAPLAAVPRLDFGKIG